jgi:hypothetical protein
MNQFNAYLGQPFEVLEAACHKAGKTIRITVLNGQAQRVTQEINVNRLNVSVDHNIVVHVGNFG